MLTEHKNGYDSVSFTATELKLSVQVAESPLQHKLSADCMKYLV